MTIRNMEELESFLAEQKLRPDAPGEVWKFSAIEAHAMVAGLEDVKPFMDEGDIEESLLFTKFYEADSAYHSSEAEESDEIPGGFSITPTDVDKGFFNAFIAMLRRHLWTLPMGVELPCGHIPARHEEILKAWYDREIIEVKKFAATRRAINTVSPEERITGKPIVARSDLERVAGKIVEKQLDEGLYSPELLEEFIQSMVEVGMSREDAEERASEIRGNTARDMREELIEKNEKRFRVVDL